MGSNGIYFLSLMAENQWVTGYFHRYKFRLATLLATGRGTGKVSLCICLFVEVC